MAMFSKLRQMLLGKPKTAGYKGFRSESFTRLRNLDPFTFQTIREMLIDPTIKLGLAMRAAPLQQAEFAYKEGDKWIPGVQADREDVAKFVLRQLQRIWEFELHKILTAQVWGWSAGEVTYRLVNNRVEVDGILHRNAMDVFALREDGEVKGVRFTRLGGAAGKVDLRFPGSIWHAYDPEAESPYGVSALKGAHSPWADKWLDGAALDTRRLFAHKDAYGGVDIAYPPGTMDVDGVEVPNRDVAREMAEQEKAGSVTTRPSIYDELSGKPLWEITRATIPSSPSHIFDYPKDLDTEMLRGLEVPDDVLKSDSGSGAWQGKQVPMLAFYTNADRWLSQVKRVVVTQVLEPLVLLNWNRAESFEVATKPLALQAMEQIKSATDSGGNGQPQPPPQQNGQPPPQAPVPIARRTNGASLQRRSQLRQLSLDSNTAELLVGRGVFDASELIVAGKDFLNGEKSNGKQRLSTPPEKPVKKEPEVSKQEQQRLEIDNASKSLSLTIDETELLERMTHG